QKGAALTLRESAHVQILGGSVSAHLLAPGSVQELVGVDTDPQVLAPTGSARFEMHGGGVSVVSRTNQSVDAVGIRARAGSAIEANGAAFELKPSGTGAARRIQVVAGGTPAAVVSAPYLWEFGADAPVAGLQSQDGADLFVETDCNAAGACSGGTEPH